MNIKWIGAVLIVISCSMVGLRIVWEKLRMEKLLRTMIRIVEYMESQLKYAQVSLSNLCRQASSLENNIVGKLFAQIADELDSQIAPDASLCIRVAIHKTKDLPQKLGELVEMAGKEFGCYGLEGQLRVLRSLREKSLEMLEGLLNNKDSRMRSYQTLGLCAGAAVVILLI